jgi:hypothetical protein
MLHNDLYTQLGPKLCNRWLPFSTWISSALAKSGIIHNNSTKVDDQSSKHPCEVGTPSGINQ